MTERDCENYKHHISRDCENCCESAEPIQAIQDCRNCKYGKYNDHWENYFCYHDKECNNWDLWESAEPTMPMFAESEQAYKAWTGEDMGKPSDLISRAELLEYATDVETPQGYEQAVFVDDINNLPSVSAERVGEWSEYKDEYHGGIMGNCSCCGKSTYNAISYDLNGNRHQYHYCPNCGARMENKK